MPLLKLPNEILIQISDCLDPKDFTNFLLLNHFFKNLLTPLLHTLAFSDPTDNLAWASRRGHEHLVRFLLEGGTPPDHQSYNRRPLHDAAQYGYMPIVKLLLQHGADISTKDDDRGTALHYAAGCGHSAIVQLLLENGADKEVNGDMIHNVTPLMWAVKGLEVAFALGIEKVDPAHTWDVYWWNEGPPSSMCTPGITRIKNEAMAQMHGVVAMLLEWGADVTYPSDTGESVLHAVAGLEGFDAVDTAKLLLEWGADLNVVDNLGVTPLHIAASSGLVGIATLFLEKGADADAVDMLGRRPSDMTPGQGSEICYVIEAASTKTQKAKEDKALEEVPRYPSLSTGDLHVQEYLSAMGGQGDDLEACYKTGHGG